MKTHNAETQASVTPRKALEFLKEGNKRFINNFNINRNLLSQVNETRDGQWPFAVILSCIDSRTSAELIFDQGLGDIFSVRIAGNIVNSDILGSMEYACKVAGSKLIAVISHSKCGAITSACMNVRGGNITELLSKIRPSVLKTQLQYTDKKPSESSFVEAVAQENALESMNQILYRSDILNEMYENGEIGLVAGHYDVETGEVTFIQELFKEN
jgi:carbonic anhydrase